MTYRITINKDSIAIDIGEFTPIENRAEVLIRAVVGGKEIHKRFLAYIANSVKNKELVAAKYGEKLSKLIKHYNGNIGEAIQELALNPNH